MSEARAMTTAEFLSALRTRDVQCWVEGERLRLRAPREVLTGELQDEIARRKPEIVSYLRAVPPATPTVPPALGRANRHRPLPLSFDQERLWFLQRLEPDSVAYNLQASLPLEGSLDLGALSRALTEVVRRHEILRTRFPEVDGRPVQAIARTAAVVMETEDLRALAAEERPGQALRIATEEVRRPFDLGADSPIRLRLLRLAEDRHELVVTQHHIVTDGWSIALLLQEVVALYTAFAAGLSPALVEPAFQYADFATWQRDWMKGEILEERLAYWCERLGGAPPALDLPTDRPRPKVQTFAGATLDFELPEELARSVQAVSRAEGVTPFMTLLAAFQVLLARYTGQEDIVVGTANGNRALVETEGMLGLFVNSVVLRTDLSGDITFRELLIRIRQTALGAFAHGDLPFEKLVEALHPPRDLARSPIFQVLFIIQNTPLETLARGSQAVPGVIGERGTAAYELSLYLIDTGRGFKGSLEYNTDLFDAVTVARLRDHYRSLLAAAVAHPERALRDLPLMTRAERAAVLAQGNATAKPVPGARVHELFAAQAAARGDALAVVAGEERLSYSDLDRSSNRLARRLRHLGVAPGALVAVHLERSLDMMVALLGVMKAGGAYVPLDPTYPRERLAFMLEDARAMVVLTEGRHAADLSATSAAVLILDEGPGEDDDTPVPPVGNADDLAYVIFTSGSTGRPKGVEIPHRALTNLLVSMAEAPGLTERDVLLAVTTLAFDIAGLELFLPLVVGGRVVLASREAAADASELSSLLNAAAVTAMQATPATWRMLVDAGWQGKSDLKVLCGGEALPVDLARALRSRCGELWNVYGPTETTIWSMIERIEDVGASVAIGRPILNTRVYVLDRRLEPSPSGAAGELYIGGAGVARGYLGRPELTAEKFVPDPFGSEPGGRLYRTGDLARYRADGRVECLGRVDHQVKLRGFRIELGEIEEVLRGHPDVRDCVVVAREHGADKRLVAYFAAPGEATPSNADLRRVLKSRLPEYMVPSTFVRMDALPRTPNGKLDRRALPPPGPAGIEREGADVPPRTPIEEAVAGMWREVLGLDRVGIHESFFDVGGHSLTATRVLGRIQDAFGIAIPLRRVFETPTIAGLAQSIETGRDVRALAAPALVPVPRDHPLPLSFAQERLWFLHHLEEAGAAYHIAGALYLKGSLDRTSFERSLAELWRRHESLRTVFGAVEGRPVQRILPPETFSVAWRDLSDLPDDMRGAEARRLASEETQRPFDLGRGPLFRATLLRLAEDEHVLLSTLHHIAADGWSLGVLVRELGAVYAAFRQGGPSPLPELRVQYADFAQWQRAWLEGGELERQLAYWRKQLAGIAVLDLPTDRPRPPLQTFRGAQYHFALPGALAAEVRTLARGEKATVFMVLLAAFQALLHRYTGQDQVTVGTPIAGRGRAALEDLVGLFANTLVLRTNLSGDPSFREALARVREVALDAYAHQETPFEKLVEDLRPERNLSVSPLFQVMFVLQNAPAASLELPGLQLGSAGLDPETSRFDLTLFLTERADGVSGTAEYNTDLFDRDTIARFAVHFQSLLEGAVSRPHERLSALPILSAAERSAHAEWNDTARPVEAASLQEKVAAQASRTPDALAVSFEGEALSYRALDARANRLAHRLRRMGVGPEVVVGIAVERSLDMVVALLGVLKAGGAYLPLDPAYPRDRLAFMLQDAQAPVLVTQSALLRALPETPAQVLCLDTEREALDAESAASPDVKVGGDNLAYLIYTSGSTGQPKGVQIPHRALGNFLEAMAGRLGLGPEDVLLSVTTLSFDIAGLEIYLPLVTGARVELVGRETSSDGGMLVERLASSGATVMQATPATWRLLLEAGWTGGGVKVLCGGEALTRDLAQELVARGAPVWNLYGPTETTIWSALHRVETAEGTAPLGRPISNTRLHVLDKNLEPVPAGVPGELHIGGIGLARGYRNRPDLTASRFIPDPFGEERGARLYRTGDVVRQRADGVVEFLGRADHQVKVRGFRIELGEVEAVLGAVEAVKAAVVLASENGPGDAQLVAYVVFEPGVEPTVTELRTRLKEKLPVYMIPSSFTVLDALPLTANGKVDRKALARLGAGHGEGAAAHVEPRTAMERLVAEVYREALGVARVGVHDNFFDLGGHSLLSMRVIARMEAVIGHPINPRELIFQTLEQFAGMCEQRARAGSAPSALSAGPR